MSNIRPDRQKCKEADSAYSDDIAQAGRESCRGNAGVCNDVGDISWKQTSDCGGTFDGLLQRGEVTCWIVPVNWQDSAGCSR